MSSNPEFAPFLSDKRRRAAFSIQGGGEVFTQELIADPPRGSDSSLLTRITPMTDAAIERLCEASARREKGCADSVRRARRAGDDDSMEYARSVATLSVNHADLRTLLERVKALEDKVEGVETDLQYAVQVAWRRGAKEWARLNYRDLIPWLEASDALNPTGEL